MRVNHHDCLGPLDSVVRSTPSVQFKHIFLSDVKNPPLGKRNCWESLPFAPRKKVRRKLGVPVTLGMVRLVFGPCLLQILGSFGQVRLYLRENGQQRSVALLGLPVSHGVLVEDGMHLPWAEDSEIRKRVAAGFDETSISHNGGLCDADDFGVQRVL